MIPYLFSQMRVAWLNTLTGAVHDELCRQIFEALGASGRAIRGAERRCVMSTISLEQIVTSAAEAMNSAAAQK
jgi:hypothetical protein